MSTPQAPAGKSSSEFKLALLTFVASMTGATALYLKDQPVLALILVGVGAFVSAAYTVCRSWLKMEQAGSIDWINERQEATLEKALHAVGTLSDVLKLVTAPDEDETEPEDSVGDGTAKPANSPGLPLE